MGRVHLGCYVCSDLASRAGARRSDNNNVGTGSDANRPGSWVVAGPTSVLRNISAYASSSQHSCRVSSMARDFPFEARVLDSSYSCRQEDELIPKFGAPRR